MGPLAIFVPALAGGGAERALVNLARGFADLGYEVDLVAATGEGPYRGEVVPTVNLVDLGADRTLKALPGLTRYLRRRRPVCLISAQEHVDVVAFWARALARVPLRLVVSLRCNASAQQADRPSIKSYAFFSLVRLLYPRADAIIAVSEGVADDAALLYGLDRDRIAVVPNPVVTPELAIMAAEPCNHPWLSPGEPPLILACGRLAPQKDFTTLLEAFARIRGQRPVRLMILGEGPERPALERQAHELGISDDLAMPGFEPNPFKYMSKSRVFVLSSRYEGLPNVLVQALACGCAVVSTDCPSGPREILEGVPQTALAPVGDVTALAACIDDFLVSDAPRSVPRAPARFDYRSAAKGYLDLCFVRVVKPASGPRGIRPDF